MVEARLGISSEYPRLMKLYWARISREVHGHNPGREIRVVSVVRDLGQQILLEYLAGNEGVYTYWKSLRRMAAFVAGAPLPCQPLNEEELRLIELMRKHYLDLLES